MQSILEEYLINEMPQQIHGLATRRLESPRENAKLFKTVKQDKSYEKFDVYSLEGEEVELYKRTRGKETEIFGLVEPKFTSHGVGYYMRYELQSADFLDVDWATQVFVWAGVFPQTRGLPEYVFFNHVLTQTGAVFSDGQQTERGQNFWFRMIGIAFSKGLNVYLVDFKNKITKKFKNYDEFRILYYGSSSPWGKDSSYQWLKIAIADFDLTWS